jgi:beta-lactamase superfamily II metal-dependent hydrolase
MFRIELLPAAHGDCIFITYGRGRKKHYILIDAGTTPTWKNELRKHLKPSTTLELFVLTHIDADHVAGAIPFLKEGTDIEIKDVWFNGWKHLPKDVLSAKQGEIFSTLIKDRGLNWNHAFNGKTIAIGDNELPKIALDGGMVLTLLSPTRKKLGSLARKWKKEIIRHGLRPGDHRQYRRFLARHPTTSTNVSKLAELPFKSDTSAPNGSSIAFVAEFEGRSALFAGDAHASVLARSIKILLKDREEDRLAMDAFKLSHHGSRGNTNAKLLSLIDCPRYLISCNGEVHNLPDNETIGRIIHETKGKTELLFNYDCDRTEAWKKADLKRRYNYSAVYGKKGYLKLDLAQ